MNDGRCATRPWKDRCWKAVAVYVALALSLSTGYTLSLPSSTFADEGASETESAVEKADQRANDDAFAVENETAASENGASQESNAIEDESNGSEPAGEEMPDASETGNETVEVAGTVVDLGNAVELDSALAYKTEDYTVEVKLSGTAGIKDLAAAPTTLADEERVAEQETVTDPALAELTMTVKSLNDDEPVYLAAKEYAEKDYDEQNIRGVDALEFEFAYKGQPLDVSECEVTAEITPTVQLKEAASQVDGAETAAEEAEVGIELIALENNEEGEAEELDSVLVEKDEQEAPVLTASLDSVSPAIQVVMRSSSNPHYTVQYWADVEVSVHDDQNGFLEIIDMSGNGDGSGGNLPQNGKDPKITKLYLGDEVDGKREVETKWQYLQLYSDNEYDYAEAPSLPYVNVFRDNSNYRAQSVWVLKKDENGNFKDPDTDVSKDNVHEIWDIYSDVILPTDVHFTNNPKTAAEDPDHYILIEDGSVIRLVAMRTEGDFTNSVRFYDYDITDDGLYTYRDGHALGINDPENYKKGTENGTKLAFGNNNTGTGLGGERWYENLLNANNKDRGYKGCTFGLVKGLDESGIIQYSDGVWAPYLFDDGDAKGKSILDDGHLNFERSGDTYTLSSVSGLEKSIENLQYFNNPARGDGTVYPTIWTNNFWPLDGDESVDGLTGTYYNYNDPNREPLVGIDGESLFPGSDDGQPHNNLFGMKYSVEFELTDDYVGPLEYYFFGDDDMWVFLDDQLVCDIGGVHSSVGAYVNLWDYIPKGDAGTHKLTFYYTERGLSGSTCYMQFTLPSVSSAEPVYYNGDLQIEKEVVGSTDVDQEFEFAIELKYKDGSYATDDYAIVRYDSDRKEIEGGGSVLSQGKGSFKLRAGEFVRIRYLPNGSTYTITETSVSGCVVANATDGGEAVESPTATGTINAVGASDYILVKYTNAFRPKMPNTGGPGTTAPMVCGAASLAVAAAVGACVHRKRIG